VGDKFIIELAEAYHVRPGEARAKGEDLPGGSPATLFRVKGFSACMWSDFGLDKLERYIEPAVGELIAEPEPETVTLTKAEAYAIAQHIDSTLLQAIRDDADIDSMPWLRAMIHGYEKLCKSSGYVGLTEHGPEDCEDCGELPY